MERTRYVLSFGEAPVIHEFYFGNVEKLKAFYVSLKSYRVKEAFQVEEVLDEKTGEVLEREDIKLILH